MNFIRQTATPLVESGFNRYILKRCCHDFNNTGKKWLLGQAKAKEELIHEAFLKEQSEGEATPETFRSIKALFQKDMKPEIIWNRFFCKTIVDKKAAYEVHRRLIDLVNKQAYDELIEQSAVLAPAKLSGYSENLILFCRANLESSYYNPYQVYKLMDSYIQKFGETAETLYLRGCAQGHRAEAAKNYAAMIERQRLNGDAIDCFEYCFPSKSKDPWEEPLIRYKNCSKASEADLANAAKLELKEQISLISTKD